MSEADDQPAEAGVGGPGNAAPTDDIDTEAFDRAPAPEDDADPEPPKAAEGDADPADKPKDPAEDDDHVEVDRNGVKYRVPKALHGELLMQADYTRKTTELAERARSFETERTTWESQREQSRAALPAEHAKVAVLESQLSRIDAALDPKGDGLGGVDWQAYRTQVINLAPDDPDRIKYDQLRAQYMALRDSRIDLGDQVKAAKDDLQTKDAARLETQRQADEAEHAKRVEDTGKALVASIPGWSPDLARETAKFMVTDLGVTVEEVGEATDPRLWIMAHRLRTAEAEVKRLKTTKQQQDTAANHEKAQATTPAATPKGGGGASARDPSTARGDELATKEWMRRRNAQMAKRAA